ncbi:UDP-glucose 4-epimerase GalE [Psychrosphaera aquimarina]|uniref:UDP-glucose 4-epimerase n=1 Tax=Psychrosphaera aquimarina TaxID=2044854 RepID=A0ABU3R503_9GAMM|nr:UDP-glucose 4-epimerase GalE [Psychrosphaera aquimarina]MDU0114584.1 UDP-glucose 4-epimerase GalE [Psychrosphaera aquimarina]
MKVLVTGGAGYIGSHTVLELLNVGYEVVVIDNLCNSSIESLNRVEELTNKKVTFYQVDICDREKVREVLRIHSDIAATIHFAALKAVGESTQIPLKYYQNNVHGTVSLLEELQQAEIYNFVFSSSATVYGEEAPVPYVETLKTGVPSSAYGKSKLMIEQVLEDLVKSDTKFKVANLRYFNPIGAHESGQIGEDPNGIPNNLMPFVSQVAVGKREKLSIFGNDYPTKDGTCERDYLHVVDLAHGHVKALEWLEDQSAGICEAFNLGTGNPLSVLEIVNKFSQVTGTNIPYEYAPQREGDLPAFWADAEKAKTKLNWTADKSLEDMMRDTWNWQSNNPQGYK